MQQIDRQYAGTLIQSVQRAAALLKVFGDQSAELGVSELSRTVNLHKSTVSRLLATLEREGLVERVVGSEKYRLGFELVRLARSAAYPEDVRTAAWPVLEQLAGASRETVNLAVVDGDEVVNVEQIAGPHLVGVSNWIGRRTPLNCVANGKALLAFQPLGEIERILSGPLPRYTELTITDPRALREELVSVRANGYAVALGEIEEGLNAVAAPIVGQRGRVIAAVSVSGPAYRVTPERITSLGSLTVDAASRISRRMGF